MEDVGNQMLKKQKKWSSGSTVTCVINGAVVDVRTYRLHLKVILMFVSDVVTTNCVVVCAFM